MFTAGNFGIACIKTLDMLFTAYTTLIIIRALISWFNPDPYNRLYQLLIKVTEPVLGPIRRIVPFTGIDVSPIIALLLIDLVIKNIVMKIAYSIFAF